MKLKELRKEQHFVDLVIEYFSAAQWFKKELFEEMCKIAEARTSNAFQKHVEHFRHNTRMGFKSIPDCLHFLHSTGRIKDPYPAMIIPWTVEFMMQEELIYRHDLMESDPVVRYRCNYERLHFLLNNNLVHNVLYGFPYIIEHYSSSVFPAEITLKSGDKSVGTSFVFEYNGKNVLCTNHHVISDSIDYTIAGLDHKLLQTVLIKEDAATDYVLFDVTDLLQVEAFKINLEFETLDEIITIGFPSVPMTRDAYKVSHKGEVNARVKDYSGNDLLIVSAKTSSGNSGSPVIDRTGTVIGMLTQELFSKDEFNQKGKLPYYAAIPSSTFTQPL